MKKLFTLIALGFAALTGLQAQRASSETEWIGRVGLNIMNAAGKDSKGLSNKIGYDLSAAFNKPIGTSGLYWGMDLGLGSRGYSAEEGDYEFKHIAHNIRWSPFMLGYKYAIADDWKLDGHIGAFASFDYAGKEKEEWEDESDEWKIGDWDDYHRFDAGLTVGIGVWYDRFNLDFTYQRGFVETWKDTKLYQSNFRLALGIVF